MPRTPRPSSEQMAAWRQLLLTYRGLRSALEHDLQRERHLSMTSYEVLLRLWEAPGNRLRMLDLARATQLSRNGLSQLVSRMEAAGLVSRCGAPDDGRGTVCSLTPEGRRAFKRAALVHVRGIQEYFASRLSDQEAVQLSALLQRVAADPQPPGSCAGPEEEIHGGVGC